MKVNYKRYGLYLLCWQASTPILAGVGILLATMGQIVSAIVANLIGGLIFFWVDQFIFTSQSLASQWEVRDNIACVDCRKIARDYARSDREIMTGHRTMHLNSGARHVQRKRLKN